MFFFFFSFFFFLTSITYIGAQYTSIVEERPEAFIPTVDFKDTFLDLQHLRNSFPGAPPLLLSVP